MLLGLVPCEREVIKSSSNCFVNFCELNGILFPSNTSYLVSKWGCSSVGRAPPLHGGSQEFESPQLHFLYTSSGFIELLGNLTVPRLPP